jgi:hypothetical protein
LEMELLRKQLQLKKIISIGLWFKMVRIIVRMDTTVPTCMEERSSEHTLRRWPSATQREIFPQPCCCLHLGLLVSRAKFLLFKLPRILHFVMAARAH